MVKLTSTNGKETDVSLDFDKACEYEANHPDWSIFIEIRQYTKTLRFTCLAVLLSLTTYKGTWSDWTKEGFTTEDLFKVLNQGLQDLGFTQEAEKSSE